MSLTQLLCTKDTSAPTRNASVLSMAFSLIFSIATCLKQKYYELRWWEFTHFFRIFNRGTIPAYIWWIQKKNLIGCNLEITSSPMKMSLIRLCCKWRFLYLYKSLLLLFITGCTTTRVTTPNNIFRIRTIGLWSHQQMVRPLQVSRVLQARPKLKDAAAEVNMHHTSPCTSHVSE